MAVLETCLLPLGMHNGIVGEKGAEKMKVLVFAEGSMKQRVSEMMKGEGVYAEGWSA